MPERMHEPSKGLRRYIAADLKPAVRNASDEESAWRLTTELLQARVENYPENYSDCYAIVREFHKLRWELFTHQIQSQEWSRVIREFSRGIEDEALLDKASPLLGIITQELDPAKMR